MYDYMYTEIAAGESTSGVFYNSEGRTMQNFVRNNITGISVDSNWTAANIAVQAYNEKLTAWETITDALTGDTLEFKVENGKRANLNPYDLINAKQVRFVSQTSDVAVVQVVKIVIIVHLVDVVR